MRAEGGSGIVRDSGSIGELRVPAGGCGGLSGRETTPGGVEPASGTKGNGERGTLLRAATNVAGALSGS